jgi:hypothetical protein
MWYEVTAYNKKGPFRLITDSEEEARDWAAAQEKKYGVKASKIEVKKLQAPKLKRGV